MYRKQINHVRRIYRGFTIVEIMIVLAIASVILLVVFEAETHLQRASRDYQRKAFARLVLAALFDYQVNNKGHQINCFEHSSAQDCATAPTEAAQFISRYIPNQTDPLTGNSFRSNTPQPVITPYCHGTATPDQTTVFCWDDRKANYIDHGLEPAVGQLIISAEHLCGTHTSTTTFGDLNLRDSPSSPDPSNNPRYAVAVMIGTEAGTYYCINSSG